MLKIILGIIIGGTLSIGYFIFSSNFSFDSNISVNIVIALATCTATAIHFDSTRKHRRDRVWDINKSILLDLTHALSDVIKETEISITEEHELNPAPRENMGYVYKTLDEKIDYALNVYRPLMNSSLIKDLENHKSIHDIITYEVNNDEIDHLDAYTKSLIEYHNLHEKLVKFIATISGVNNS